MSDPVSAEKSSARRSWRLPIKLLGGVLICALIVYVGQCAYLYFEQGNLLYPEARKPYVMDSGEAIREARKVGLVPWDHPTSGSMEPQGYVRPDFNAPTTRGTIVMFHGNGAWCGEKTENIEAMEHRGFRVFLYEYPGYGGRPGRPSEAVIVPDARALIHSLDQAGYGPIYVWGESLGSGVAAAVCGDPTSPVHGLALLMPWDSLTHVARYRYPGIPVSLLLKERYNSVSNLKHFKHPICVVRGDLDETIPPSLTLNLFAHLPNPKKIIVEEHFGHGNWPRTPDLPWWDDVLNFIAPPERALAGR